jgi:Cu2+-exporting ATPase
MSDLKCDLCGLPTPEPPITAPNEDGDFCCTGCLHVHELLQEIDSEQAEQIREETIRRRHQEWEEEHQTVPTDAQECFLNVDGMHCATCESFIEALAHRHDGIYKSEASYASEMVKVYYDSDRVSEQELPGLISKMGYTAYPMNSVFGKDDFNTMMRLILGSIFFLYGLIVYGVLLYPLYLTGHEVIPFHASAKYFFITNLLFMSSIILFYTGYPILRGAWVSISVRKPNMDLLIAIAALSAYLFSLGALIMGINELYFDVTTAIIMAVSLGKFYESRMKKNKNSLLADLMENRIKQARVRRDGSFAMINIEEVTAGDEVMVKAGERIPVDGTIVEGEGVINEALVTGESLPVHKGSGDRAISGTVLTQNALTIRPDEEVRSTVEKMIRLMWDIQAGRPGKQRLVDKIAAWFVPAVLVLGVITFVIHLIIGDAFLPSLLAALVVLIVSCPCALGLATPLAVASGLRDSFKNNIIFKSGALFEQDSDVDILAFDKTGTLTTGTMQLQEQDYESKALRYAAALEQYASHPVAEAIAREKDDPALEVKDFKSGTRGVCGTIEDQEVWVGQPEWLEDRGMSGTNQQRQRIEAARSNGMVPTGIAWQGQIQEILVVGDQLRSEASEFIEELKQQGKQIAVITGDSDRAAEPLRQALDPDYLFTEASPESKTEIIEQLKERGSVAMIGDGSNDALAMAEADIGMAFGDLTAIAADSSQIVIPSDELIRIPQAFSIIEQTQKRIRQNLGWAFLYNATAIPLAISGLINPLFAALAMAGSSLLVVSNSSRKMKV